MERAETLTEGREPGQPILVGHHSERHARSIQKKVDAVMDKAASELEKADWLDGNAKSSERHQHYKQGDAGLAARRVEKLEADLRKFERNAASYEPARYFLYAKIYPERTEETRLAALAEHNRKVEVIKAELEAARQLLAELGSNPAERLNIEVGDIVQVRHSHAEVMQVNPKTCILKPVGYTTGYKYNRTEVKAIVQKAAPGYADKKKDEEKAKAKAKASSETQYKLGDIVEYSNHFGVGEPNWAEVISIGPKNLTVRRLDGYFKGHVDSWLRRVCVLRACALPVRVEQIKAEQKAAKAKKGSA